MAKKKIVKVIKLQILAGKANPAPPIGPALGAAGINIMAFCKEFNAKTQGQNDLLPVVIDVYADRTYSFITKQPPVASLILKAAGLEKGSGVPNKEKVGKITKDQVREIANRKAPDMRAASTEMAMHMVMGTARSMGIEIEG